MDDILQWLPLVLAIFAAGTAWGAHRLSANHMSDRIQNTQAVIDKLRSHHTQHFDTAAELRVAMGEVKQRICDHERQDDSRFTHIEDLMSEVRGDIKEILKSLRR